MDEQLPLCRHVLKFVWVTSFGDVCYFDVHTNVITCRVGVWFTQTLDGSTQVSRFQVTNNQQIGHLSNRFRVKCNACLDVLFIICVCEYALVYSANTLFVDCLLKGLLELMNVPHPTLPV